MVTRLTVSTSTPSIALGTSAQFTARGAFSDGAFQDLSASATWTSAPSGSVSVTGGLAQSVHVGTANVTASFQGFSGTAPIGGDRAIALSSTRY